MNKFSRFSCQIITLLAFSYLVGCASADKQTLLQTPSTARPKPIQGTAANMGSLYPSNSGSPMASTVSHRPLFEDRRARNVGDILTVVLNETTAAAKGSSLSAARKATATNAFGVTAGVGAPFGEFAGIRAVSNYDGSADLKSEGSGASAANNTFAGTITVTVVEILSNGNLVVAGEKQVAISNEEEIIRFGGIVNPNTLVYNRVNSQEVADARIEYRGRGVTDDTQGVGWFSRLLFKLSPF
jgi:flagellar L-ring protein FlgH